ncbi:MAG: MobP3 family relaxase [Faecousia sp.]
MARLIMKSPYLKPGGKKSPGGYLRYIATREGVEMVEDTSRHLPATAEQQKHIAKLLKKYPDSKDCHEYQDYADNSTRGNADAFINSILELHGDAPQRDVYLKYIDERPGSNGLFTDEGVPIVLSQVQEEMNNHPGNIWTHIISLHREDAERLGYNTPDAWIHLLRSQRNRIAQQMKISPENFRWYAAFHNSGNHPHVHMMAYSVDPNEAYLSTKGIETIKSNLAQEIFRQDLLQIYQKQSDLRNELRQESRDRITEIVDAINHGSFDNPQIQMMMVQLTDRLSKAKGKKQYGYLSAGTKKLVDSIVAELAKDNRIQELYSLWYEQKEDVLRTYTNKMPERIPLEQQKEFKAIRNAVVQAALAINLPPEVLPLSDPVPPCVDFVDDGTDVYPKAIRSLREPEVEPIPEVKQFLHEAAIRGSVDAVYGVGKQYLKTDVQKAISMFELAAEQGNSYAEYQLGKLYCFGQGVPLNLEAGMEWLRVSASHGNEYASILLEKVQNHIHQQTTSAVLGLFRWLAGMIQTSANHHIRRRNSIDRKQRQKTEEKKQAHGQRSDGQDYNNDMEQTM